MLACTLWLIRVGLVQPLRHHRRFRLLLSVKLISIEHMTFIEEGFKLKMAVSSENKNHYFSFGHTLTSSLGKVSFIGELINSCICMTHSGTIKQCMWLNQCIYSCHGLKEAMSRKASRRRQININVLCTITCVSLSWSHSSQYSSNFKSQMLWQPHSLTKV